MRIEHPCNTIDWYIGALLTEWTYTNQPLFQPHFLGLGEYFMGLICPEWCGILSIQYMAKQLSWRSLYIWLQQSVVKFRVLSSVTTGSGPSLRVRVRVGTEPEPDWRSGSSINPNCRFGYGSIHISLPVWIGRVPSVLYSGSICKFILHACFSYSMIVLNQNRSFDIQYPHFACFAYCEIDNILIHVFLLMLCIFDQGGGQ